MTSDFAISESGDALILAAYGVDGTGKGTPSAVTYDVQITTVGGQVINLQKSKPNQLRPPDLVKLVAAKPGHTGRAMRIGNYWYFNVVEIPDIAECTGAA